MFFSVLSVYFLCTFCILFMYFIYFLCTLYTFVYICVYYFLFSFLFVDCWHVAYLMRPMTMVAPKVQALLSPSFFFFSPWWQTPWLPARISYTRLFPCQNQNFCSVHGTAENRNLEIITTLQSPSSPSLSPFFLLSPPTLSSSYNPPSSSLFCTLTSHILSLRIVVVLYCTELCVFFVNKEILI